MTIRTNSLTELLKILPGDATVRGFEEGLTLMNADGTGQIVMLNDNFYVSATGEKNGSHPTPFDSVTSQNALETTHPIHAHKLRIVARRSV
jgi:hypothetical protein